MQGQMGALCIVAVRKAMKYIICPYCKRRITEEELRCYERSGGRVVMNCPNCKRRLAFRILEEEPEVCNSEPAQQGVGIPAFAYLKVIENVFGYAQRFPLVEGLNRVGRYNDRFSELEVPIRTNDPSVDRNHCMINVQSTESGEVQVEIWDNDSMTGTFINTRELMPDEHHLLQEGEVITLGATSIIFTFSKE